DILQRLDYLRQKQVGKLLPRSVHQLASVGSRERSPHLDAESLGQLRRPQLRVVGPKAQDGMERMSCLPLAVGQRLPNPCQQHTSSSNQELALGVFVRQLRDAGFQTPQRANVVPGLPAFVVVIGGQMEEGSLDKVTKAASRRVGATKITAQKAQGKLLG